MPSYIIRNIDAELWRRVKIRAATESKPLLQVIMQLLKQYASGKADKP